MYLIPGVGFSGAIHLIARRPYIAALVAAVALSMSVAKTPPGPPASPAPTVPGARIVKTGEPVPNAVGHPAPDTPSEVEILQTGVKPGQVGKWYFKYNNNAHVDSVCKTKLDDIVPFLKASNRAIVFEIRRRAKRSRVVDLIVVPE